MNDLLRLARVRGLCQPVSLVVVCLQLLCVRFRSHARPVQSQTAVCLAGSAVFIHSLFHASTRAQMFTRAEGHPPSHVARCALARLWSVWPHFQCLLVCLVCCGRRWSECEYSSDSVAVNPEFQWLICTLSDELNRIELAIFNKQFQQPATS